MSPEIIANLVTLFTIVVGTGGVAGAVYAWFKLRPEVGLITVDAAHKVVQFQAEVIERIEAENKELRQTLEAYRLKVEELHDRVRELERRVPS